MIHRVLILILTLGISLAQQQQPVPTTPLEKAVVAYRAAQYDEALQILDKELTENPENFDCRVLRGDIYSYTGQTSKALETYSELVRLRKDSGVGYYRRAMEYFRAARLNEAIADFDKLAELYPEQAPQLWQRGICYYYAGEYEKGRKQFESHQTVNKQDVENAVWHFLCVAKLEGFDKARQQLIPIAEDRRVPMTQIHGVFAGSAKEEDVFKAANAGNPKPEELKDRLFYAHLYLALFEEVRGNAKKSLDHIRKATTEFSQKHYMGTVARVHAALRDKQAN